MDLTNKICFVLLHGRSLEELERRIDQFKNLDVVWCGMNYFNPSEEIIKKIGKEFSIVFDCSTVKNNVSYELNIRIPRFREYLNRPIENKYITLRTGRDNLFELRNKIAPNFNQEYKNKIIYSEDLGFDTTQFCVSLHLYLITLIKMGARKIILFGADGGGSFGNAANSYYKWELMATDRNFGCSIPESNIVGDANNVNTTFEIHAKNILGYIPEILNCSPDTRYTCFRKISYDEVIKEAK